MKGSWIHSSRNVKYNGNKIECELKNYKGDWIKNEIIYSPDYEYDNIDGKFQCFDKTILFLVINMKKNTDRWEVIQTSLEKINCHYVRIEGIDGTAMEEQEIVPELIGTEFHCYESNDSWIYNGEIAKSFPGLKLNGHHGTKGLTLSNMKCFKTILDEYPNYNWYCVLEDDSILDETIYNKIKDCLNEDDVILLDIRPFGGACAVLYNQRIISRVLKDLHPLSDFSIHHEKKTGLTNLWDWKLWSYLKNDILYSLHPIVPSGLFKSEISISSDSHNEHM